LKKVISYESTSKSDFLRALRNTNYFQAAVLRFLQMNGIRGGIIRKHQINGKLTERETQRNRWIAKVRYQIEQYFGLSALHQWAGPRRFTTVVKDGLDRLLGVDYSILKSSNIASFF
jgi:hypothetical protein